MSGEGSGSAQGTEKQNEEEEKIEEDIALRRRPWAREEDEKLSQKVEVHGDRHWSVISSEIPGRCDMSCRQRWFGHLSPNIDRRLFSAEEDDILVRTQRVHGNKWATIAQSLPGRTPNAIRNRWHSNPLWRKRHAEGSQQLTPNSSGERRSFTAEEDDIMLRAQLKHGNKWSTIAKLLPGRTSTSVQNRWRSNLRWRERHAEGSQQQQQDLSFVGTSASSSSHSEIDFLERKRLCQIEEENVETPEIAWAMSLLEPDPITSLSPSLPGSGGDGGGSGGDEKKE